MQEQPNVLKNSGSCVTNWPISTPHHFFSVAWFSNASQPTLLTCWYDNLMLKCWVYYTQWPDYQEMELRLEYTVIFICMVTEMQMGSFDRKQMFLTDFFN